MGEVKTNLAHETGSLGRGRRERQIISFEPPFDTQMKGARDTGLNVLESVLDLLLL